MQMLSNLGTLLSFALTRGRELKLYPTWYTTPQPVDKPPVNGLAPRNGYLVPRRNMSISLLSSASFLQKRAGPS